MAIASRCSVYPAEVARWHWGFPPLDAGPRSYLSNRRHGRLGCPRRPPAQDCRDDSVAFTALPRATDWRSMRKQGDRRPLRAPSRHAYAPPLGDLGRVR